MRAISTVLDASLCLLLVTASALTLVGTPLASETNPDAADETVEALTTTTARVTYAVGEQDRSTHQERTVHDTLAGLLAATVLADANESTTAFQRNATSTAFQQAVTARVTRAVRRPDVGVQVIARPRGDDQSASGNRVTAGENPPPDVDLHAAAVEVLAVRLTVRTWSR